MGARRGTAGTQPLNNRPHVTRIRKRIVAKEATHVRARDARTVTATVLAILVLGAATAGAARAAGGPVWFTKEFAKELPATASRGTEAIELAGTKFKLKTALLNIECSGVGGVGSITGGNPGTGQSTILFSGCSVGGKTVAECGLKGLKPAEPAGTVYSSVKSVLVYPKGAAEGTETAYDALVPEGKEDLFAEYELTGTNCGTLRGKAFKVTATGTEITEPAFKHKCGLLAEVGKIEGGRFAKAKSGEEKEDGALSFKEPPVTEAELWTGTFAVIKCKLEVNKKQPKSWVKSR